MLKGYRIHDTNLGPTNRASGYHPKPLTPLKVEPNTVGLLLAEWLILFQPHPNGPPGIITLLQGKPHNRVTWNPDIHEDWYIMPAMLHYQYLISYTTKTTKEQVSNTTDFLPSTSPPPIL